MIYHEQAFLRPSFQTLESHIEDACLAQSDPDCPIRPTEIFYSDRLSQQIGANVWIASEVHQTTGAYKIRGAYNKMRQLAGDEEVVTASAGNHAQGVALCARALGVTATVFMPSTTPECKISAVEQNARVILTGDTFDDSYAQAVRYNDRRSATFIHPFDDEYVIAGQGTLGVEVGDSLEDIDAVFAPVGGGGLLSGLGTALRMYYPDIDLYGVEPEGAASMSLALNLGRVAALKSIDTFVDGASVKQIGRRTYRLLSGLGVKPVTVSNMETVDAVRGLWLDPDSPRHAERAGALSVAGALKKQEEITDKNILCVVSGGNLSRDDFEAMAY